ncbi:MAG: anti-sigma factor family protein [Pirellulales bacterium]
MRIKCEDMLSALGDYLDGELPDEMREAFEEHMAGCSPCEVVVDNLRKTITVYKAGKSYELPAEFHERIRGALRRRWKEKFPDAAC